MPTRRDLAGWLAELDSGDDPRAEAAALALAEFGPDALPDLLVRLESGGEAAWWALRAITALNLPETPGLLTQALLNPDPAVQQCALVGLRQQPTPQAISNLINLLQSAGDSLSARLAADALAAIGPLATPALLEVLADGAPSARVQVVRALAVIGDQRSIPALFAALDDDSAWIAYWANEGLERMGVGMSFFRPG